MLWVMLRGLLAAYLVLAGGYVSFVVGSRLAGRSTVPVRWVATGIAGIWLASLTFHLLAAMTAFSLPIATLTVTSAAAATRAYGPPFRFVLERLERDRRWLGRSMRLAWGRALGWYAACIAAFVGVVAIRTVLLPPLSWDALTYHAVKAGLWVQSAGLSTVEYPGGWQWYRLFPGGAEILAAWAMLPFHGDLIVCAVDVVQWLLVGFCVHAIAKEIGLRAREAWVCAGFVMCAPCVSLAVGSLYVDLSMTIGILAGFLFGLRLRRRARGGLVLLTFMALGIAAAAKVTAWPAAGLIAVLAAGRAFIDSDRKGRLLSWTAAGALAVALLLGPWFLRSYEATGYPLSPLDIRVAGVTLGEGDRRLKAFVDQPGLQPYSVATEYPALRELFNLRPRTRPNFGPFSILPVVMSMLGLPALLRRRSFAALLLTATVLSFVLLYFSPGFSGVRLQWAKSNARFLLPAFCLVIPAGFGWCGARRLRLSRLYLGLVALSAILAAGTVLHNAGSDLARVERIAVPVALSVLLAGWGVGLLLRAGTARHRASVAAAALILVTVGLLAPLSRYKHSFRYVLAREARGLHLIPSHWQRAAELIDTPRTPRHIAVVGSAEKQLDGWFTYYFLGEKLQNRLVSIPIGPRLRSEEGQGADLPEDGRFLGWLRALTAAGVSHVVSFVPGSVELTWIESHPELFEKLSEDVDTTGGPDGPRKRMACYRLRGVVYLPGP